MNSNKRTAEQPQKLKDLGSYKHEVTSIHSGKLASPGKLFVVVRVYGEGYKWVKGKKVRDKWTAHVECSEKDIDTAEKQQVITDHIFKQIKERYKLQ